MLNLSDVKTLLNHTDEPVLSLYLKVDPALPENQASTPAWRIHAKNSLSNADRPEQQTVPGELRLRVEQYLDDSPPACKGLALFFSPSLEQVYKLPLAVEHQAAYGKPLIAPLLALMADYKAHLIVMVDHAQARFFTTSGGQIQLQDTMELKLDTHDWRTKTAMPSHIGIGRGNATDEYQDRVVETMTRLYQHVAVRAGRVARQHQTRWIVLAGDENSAHTVCNFLPNDLKTAVVVVMPLPMRYTPAEVLKHVLPVLTEHEQQDDLSRVEQIIDLAKAGGRGALGAVAVRHALEQGRIEELIAPYTGVQDSVIQDLIFEVITVGGTVKFVRDAAATRLMTEGGVAAQLYYAV
jgi:Bacterial archaeo-eukaryotic release factor family 10